MLDNETKTQLLQYLELLENDIVLKVSTNTDESSIELEKVVNELAELSPKISVKKTTLERTPSFSVNRVNEDSGIIFAGIPLGHEFTSLVLALLQVSGRAPRLEQDIINKIKKIDKKYDFISYISLSCHNCPDVVQALNMMCILNPNITHTMVDGAIFTKEAEEKNVMAVPTVFSNGEFFSSGRIGIEEILEKMGLTLELNIIDEEPFDVLVVGGGPAGASAAIYAARKGVRTALVAKRFGGQIMDTLSIENLIGTTNTTGPNLAKDLETHIKEYDITLIKNLEVKNIRKNAMFELELQNGSVLRSKTVIVATGAAWRNLGVPGENEFKNKGVAYCPHCDGPIFKGKPIAVVGGGNSGIEAAIDLAGTSSFVTVLEFMPELKADQVLQERLKELPNVKVLTNVAVNEILGQDKVSGIKYTSRDNNEEFTIDLDGVFVQIGLAPNTNWLGDFVERNRFGEIIIDSKGATNVPGLFAAGDCTTSPYKQIIISMGSGATASLSAFDYLIRN